MKSHDKEISLNPIVNTNIKFKWKKLPVEDKDCQNEEKSNSLQEKHYKSDDISNLKTKQGKTYAIHIIIKSRSV